MDGRVFVRPIRASLAIILVGLSAATPAAPAHAYPFDRTLTVGTRGGDVRALEVRIAGWFPARSQKLLSVDRTFGRRTFFALKAFQRHMGLSVDGVSGPQTFAALSALEDRDGSTKHFGWGEFAQRNNPHCSRRANRFAGTFRGGAVPSTKVKGGGRTPIVTDDISRPKEVFAGASDPMHCARGRRAGPRSERSLRKGPPPAPASPRSPRTRVSRSLREPPGGAA